MEEKPEYYIPANGLIDDIFKNGLINKIDSPNRCSTWITPVLTAEQVEQLYQAFKNRMIYEER